MDTPRFNRRQAARLGAGLGLLLAGGAAALARPSQPLADAQDAQPNPRLLALSDAYMRRLHALFPLDATEMVGDTAYEAAFEVDIAPAHRQRQRALSLWLRARLRGFDRASLNRDDAITWDLLDHEVRQNLALQAHPQHLTPIMHWGGLPVRFANWASGDGPQPMKTAANYDHFRARLARLPDWVNQAIANMEEGMARGITAPRALIERALPAYDKLLPDDPAQSPYLAGIRNFPQDIAEADRKRIAAQYTALVARRVEPSVRKLRAFLRDRYVPAARTTAGLGALPGGAAWYDTMVRVSTTTDMTAQQVHEVGLKEVARIRADMERVKARFGDTRPLNAFLSTFEERPEVKPFRTDADILRYYADLNQKVKQQLPALFERAPRAPLEIRMVSELDRDTASDNYVPPAADGSRPGVFYAAVPRAETYPMTRMAALFLHEGQPGHHYQIATQQELPLSKFRRAAWYDAYGEGWGLYAESLGGQLGVYDEPTPLLGRLLMELHRALRLVVDTGLHHFGWSREQTIAYLMEMEGTDEPTARRAAERYMAAPGQALAYKIGELKIIELRERARAKLGEAFDIRSFHTQVLRDGSMPLSMLEARIDAWIAGGTIDARRHR